MNPKPGQIAVRDGVNFGRPYLKASGVPTWTIADQFRAGDSVATIARWFGIPRAQVEIALRYELETPARKRKMEDRHARDQRPPKRKKVR